jgi:hypothetical protein
MRYGNSKRDMSRLAAAKRKRTQRNRMRSLGFKLIQVWVHPKDRRSVIANVRRLLKKRLEGSS